MNNKYDTSQNVEDQYEPGSNGKVLKNLLGITDLDEMNAIEYKLLCKTEEKYLEEITIDLRFTAKYIYDIHKYWLGKVYPWAGRPRTVQIRKGGITFCMPEHIEKEMNRLEEEELKEYTPCNFKNIDKIAKAMAVVHSEFELIHPFREGNGRIGRLIITLMASQAGYAIESLDEYIANNWDNYISGIYKGLDKDYSQLTCLFRNILLQDES